MNARAQTDSNENQLTAALVAVGYKPPKKLQNGLLELNEGQKVCLTFDWPLNCLPEGTKIMPAGTGSAYVKNPDEELEVPQIKIDLDGFLSRCSVQSFMVCNGVNKRSARVYVNCIVIAGKNNKVALGKNYVFLCRVARSTFTSVAIRRTKEQLSIVLGKASENGSAEKIRFAITNASAMH